MTETKQIIKEQAKIPTKPQQPRQPTPKTASPKVVVVHAIEKEKTADDNVIDKLGDELSVTLPGKRLPVPIRVIIFFTLGGAISIMGSMFLEDLVSTANETLSFYVYRTIIGIIALAVVYGMLERERWALWLYALLAVIAIFAKPLISIVPVAVVVYLFTKRNLFAASFIDNFIEILLYRAKKQLEKFKKT